MCAPTHVESHNTGKHEREHQEHVRWGKAGDSSAMLAVEPYEEHGYAHDIGHSEVDPEEDDEGARRHDLEVIHTVL